MKTIKTILTNLPFMTIWVSSFTIISIMDLVLLLIMLLIKATRLIAVRLLAMFDWTETPATYKGIKEIVNLWVNRGYKYYIDLVYPAEDDEEES